MSKHTPGPWEYFPEATGEEGDGDVRTGYDHDEHGPVDIVLSVFLKHEDGLLISAAPDMLEVLEEIEAENDNCPCCSCWLSGEKNSTHEQGCKFAAALKKARGETE